MLDYQSLLIKAYIGYVLPHRAQIGYYSRSNYRCPRDELVGNALNAYLQWVGHCWFIVFALHTFDHLKSCDSTINEKWMHWKLWRSGHHKVVTDSMGWHWAWWRHQMETFSALLALCVGNSPVTGEFPSQRPVTRSFDVFFALRLNKRLSKQS